MSLPREGRRRVVVEGVTPQVDAGRFAAKRVVGDRVIVEADVFTDGHDRPACVVRHRPEGDGEWREAPMAPLVNDRWRGGFELDRPGRHVFDVLAWIDRFETWHRDLLRREEEADIALALLAGAELVEEAVALAGGIDAARLADYAEALKGPEPVRARRALADELELAGLMRRYAPRAFLTEGGRELPVVADRERARFSTWYELFPRSHGAPGRHGTLRECEARLPYVARMGFDVLYLPPIHPIGETHRKGRNNARRAQPGDVGSPSAIGAEAGGHTAVHPELGTIEDFRRFRAAAESHGIELALDIAFQCSPDHPYVRERPEWFRERPDGSIQYAENPPKKYEDIYPFNFDSEAWRELWAELRAVVQFWIDEGVRIFRVDNPHTKPFPFWEWLIGDVKRAHPEVIFLSEAFARPKIMYRLAKLGFDQSYTYFAWRNTREELTAYMTELTDPARGVCEFFRPNFWPNTPDILTEYLQLGGRPAFMARAVLAGTLTASYGIYGPAFELCESEPREPGSEEYADSEKYQIREWDLERPDSLADYIARINAARREHPALQRDEGLRFHDVDNPELIAYSKRTDDLADVVVCVVNLDPHHVQSGWVHLELERFGLDPERPFQMHELISGARYLWHGPRNYVRLDPASSPAQIFSIRSRMRSERDFEYFF